MTRPSVLILYPGAVSRDIGAQMELLVDAVGAQLTFISLDPPGSLHDHANSLGGSAFSLSEEGFSRFSPWNPRLLTRILRLMRARRISHVLSHTQQANLIAATISRVYPGTVFLVRHHSDYVASGTALKPKIADRFINLLGRRHVAVSDAVLNQMVVREGVPAGRVVRMDLGFRFDRFPEPDREAAKELRARFRGQSIVLTVGRLIECKRHDSLVQAAAVIARRRKDLAFVFLGQGPLRERLEAQTESLGLENVHFLGHVSKIQDYYAAAELLVHPSMSEASCNTLKEALYYRLPFLARKGVGDIEDYCDCPDFLIPKHAGPEEMASRIEDLLARRREDWEPDPALRVRMMERFGIEKQAPILRMMLHRT